jgi:hypothetical protein
MLFSFIILLMRFQAFWAATRFHNEISRFFYVTFMRFLSEVIYCLLRNFLLKLRGSLVGNECKLGGGGLKCEYVGRQKGLRGRCLLRVTSMHYIKSIRICEDDVT